MTGMKNIKFLDYFSLQFVPCYFLNVTKECIEEPEKFTHCVVVKTIL